MYNIITYSSIRRTE